MKIGKTLYTVDRKEWREWLKQNHKKETEIWLIYYLKSSDKPRIPYNDAVEEALCYGWIDSTVKKIDEESIAQRFSERRKSSDISPLNKERIWKLLKQKKMTKIGLDAVAHIFDPEKEKPEDYKFPDNIIQVLKKDKQVWQNFQKFSPSYQRVRIAYIEHQAKTGEENFNKSLNNFIKFTAQNKLFGSVKDL